MRVLIINFTRFGDLLQTAPVICGLKAQGHEVGLLCLNNFAATLPLLRGVDATFTLPGNSLLAQLDRDWRTALASADALIAHIQATFPVDRVYNNTATLAARLLARRLSPKGVPILGFGVDAEGFGVSGNAWATFLLGGSQHREHCPFNIADMFRAAAGLAGEPPRCGLNSPPPAVAAASLELLRALTPAAALDTSRGYVALQLGASAALRQWPADAFAQVGQHLWDNLRLTPVLLGSESEKPLADAYSTASRHPFVDAVGRTDLMQLAGVLNHCELLISNDTGTMHLAAGLGRPVLGLFLATAQPWDTAPYAENCCCLEPALPCHPCGFGNACPEGLACRGHIPVQTVAALAAHFLRSGEWRMPPRHGGEARVWTTCRDAHGFAALRCLSGHEREPRSQRLYFQRVLYRQLVDMLDGQDPGTSSDTEQEVAACGLSAPERAELAGVLSQGAGLLRLLAEQATLAQRMPQLGARMLATTQHVQELLENCHALGALAFLWRNLVQERGGDVANIRQMALQLAVSFDYFQKQLA